MAVWEETAEQALHHIRHSSSKVLEVGTEDEDVLEVLAVMGATEVTGRT
jgi:hypothetical protein